MKTLSITEENDKLLVKNFPKLYRNRYASSKITCMCWGFPSAPGWFQLIWNLSEKLEKMILAEPEDPNNPICALQVKQKFGTLRYYMSGPVTQEMQKLINEAEEASITICERCGKTGKLTNSNGYLHVACPEHEKESP